MRSLLRLEAAGVVRARWFLASIGVSAALVLFFVVLATRESAVLAFTGYARVVTGTGMAGLLFLPLLAVFSTVQAVTGARRDGVLEWYLSHPVSRDAAFTAMFLPRLVAVGGPILVAVLLLAAVAAAFGHPVQGLLLLRLLGLLLGQAFCFSALGMAITVASRSPEQALLRGLFLWMAAAALIDFALIGVMLRWNLPAYAVFLLSAINPVQAGRLGLLAGADAQLGVLGPVGTWISLTLGPGGTLAYALGWPLLVGALALVLGRRGFVRGDLL